LKKGTRRGTHWSGKPPKTKGEGNALCRVVRGKKKGEAYHVFTGEMCARGRKGGGLLWGAGIPTLGDPLKQWVKKVIFPREKKRTSKRDFNRLKGFFLLERQGGCERREVKRKLYDLCLLRKQKLWPGKESKKKM